MSAPIKNLLTWKLKVKVEKTGSRKVLRGICSLGKDYFKFSAFLFYFSSLFFYNFFFKFDISLYYLNDTKHIKQIHPDIKSQAKHFFFFFYNLLHTQKYGIPSIA